MVGSYSKSGKNSSLGFFITPFYSQLSLDWVPGDSPERWVRHIWYFNMTSIKRFSCSPFCSCHMFQGCSLVHFFPRIIMHFYVLASMLQNYPKIDFALLFCMIWHRTHGTCIALTAFSYLVLVCIWVSKRGGGKAKAHHRAYYDAWLVLVFYWEVEWFNLTMEC